MRPFPLLGGEARAAASAALVDGPHATDRGLELAELVLDFAGRAAIREAR